MKKYYKVTTKDLKSCTTTNKDFHLPDKYKVQYKLNKEVRGPDNTPLFVFDSLIRAQEFSSVWNIHDHKTARIFECEVTKPRKVKYMSFLDMVDKFLLFMEKRRLKKKVNSCAVFSPPSGTWAVSSVKLLKEINWRK